MTQKEYEDYLHKRGLRDPKSKCVAKNSLGGTTKGKEKSLERVIVCFKGYRTRPLDADNFAGSVKHLLDGLRAAGIIDDDDPTTIELRTEQVKVKHRHEQKTVITLYYPD